MMTAKRAAAASRRARRARRRRRALLGIIPLFVLVVLVLAAIMNPWPALRLLGVPGELVSLAQRYPETRSYVKGYLTHHDQVGDCDISGELADGQIPLFIQWDERWGYGYYGRSIMGAAGCGPTALSMVYSGLTKDPSLHPLAMAEYADEAGYHVEGSGTAWDFMKSGAEALGLTSDHIGVDGAAIRAALEAGKPVIAIMGPGHFTTGGHFIVLTGVAEDGTIRVNDSNSPRNSGRTWSLETLTGEMRDAWAYSL